MKLTCTLPLVTALMLATAGCKSGSSPDGTPAVIVDPTEESHAALMLTVTRMLNGTPVRLAGDALTEDSVLVVERRAHRTIEGRPATGRMRERPEHFRLVIEDGDCVLVHLRTSQRATLPHTDCQAR